MAEAKATVIGYGHMGQACVASLVRNGAFDQSEFQIIKRAEGQGSSSAVLSQSVSATSKLVVLAIKPADFKGFLEQRIILPSDALVVSMMAGVSSASLRSVFPSSNIVRFMTNLAVAEGQGVGCYYFDAALTELQLNLLGLVCSSFGTCYQVREERLLDSATALVGTLPALFYHFLEGVAQAGVALGFDPNFSEQVARQVVHSSFVKLQDGRAISLTERIGEIASKGGTTEAMLQNLGQEFQASVLKALQAAAKKSQDLGKFT